MGKNAKKTTATENYCVNRQYIIGSNTPFAVMEEYKTLRTNIIFSVPSSECTVVGFTSGLPGEGKSLTCLNTAIAFAQTGARTVILDCDLRVPMISRLLDEDAVPGLSNVLIGKNTVGQAIKKTAYPNLDFVPSGDVPPNPSELLGSDNMAKLIELFSKAYDYIIVDLPPIGVVSDAAVMSKHLSGIILVVRSRLARQEDVSSAIDHLTFVGAHVLGIVLNAVDLADGGHSGYGKYGKYNKYNKYSKYSDSAETTHNT